MNKLKLDLDRLRVDSFDTSTTDGAAGGTVHGHYSQVGTCSGRVATCQYGGTCGTDCATRNCVSPYCL